MRQERCRFVVSPVGTLLCSHVLPSPLASTDQQSGCLVLEHWHTRGWEGRMPGMGPVPQFSFMWELGPALPNPLSVQGVRGLLLPQPPRCWRAWSGAGAQIAFWRAQFHAGSGAVAPRGIEEPRLSGRREMR